MTICVAVLAFFLALGITLYPIISTAYNEKHQSKIQTQYREQVAQVDNSEIRHARELAIAYNEAIQPGQQLTDAFSNEALLWASEDYAEQLNITGNGTMGYVKIPKIDVHLPIFHGTDSTTLERGIGHLLGSSLPVGGDTTHTVLTAHSGMANQKMFSDLPQLKIGDVFYLDVLGETLAYQVDQIKTVLPHDTTYLGIEEGQDYCTLITCTPFGVNTHRLLVRGSRIPYEEAEEIVADTPRTEKPVSNWEQEYRKGLYIGLGAVAIMGMVFCASGSTGGIAMRVLKAIVCFVMAAVFLVGFAICAFPFIQRIVMDNQLKEDAYSFLERLDTVPTQTESTAPTDTTTPTEIKESPVIREHEELWEDMVAYNQRIWEEKQVGLCDPWSYQQPSFTLGEYGLEDEIFGVISIPSLDIEMPLYLGATTQHMAKGAAHLSQTSLPIGGENTNCVIAGHRGYSGASYFRYVPELQPGDEVIITNLWCSMTYTVTGTQIIDPHEVDQILIQEGRDMITLLTCHPYASGGRQRFLVFCDRVTNGERSQNDNGHTS